MLRGESSSNESLSSYHVFLSCYRNELGTDLNFSNHLYDSLQRKGIAAYYYRRYDEEPIEEVVKAIEESLAAVVILSKNYACCTWCLDQLQLIIEESKKEKRKLVVIPIFYGVSPAEVRFQKINSFGEAFREYEVRFEGEKEKVQKWRDCLKEIAGISGCESNNKHETKLIEDVIESIWTKIRNKLPSYDDNELVGIDSRVEKIDSLLRIEFEDVRFIGIWGMGGIGKTTLAKVVLNRICNQFDFDVSCFLENVRENFRTTDGILSLQRTLLSHTKIKGFEINDLDGGKKIIQENLFNKKVLLVVDDVDDMKQLDYLAINQEWFGPGSRVIITTRDMELLRSFRIFECYKMDLLNSEESLQLFTQIAFKRDEPLENFLELSKVAIQHASGLPLALKVLGSSLCGRSEFEWEQVLKKINEHPNIDIVMKKLRISYDGLPELHKTLFLDIACFFKGWAKEQVTEILTICDRYLLHGIEVLIDKALVTYDGLCLGLHPLLEEMGRKIVAEKCLLDASKRSRLWSLEDIDQVLNNNKATDMIQGIVLKPATQPYIANWDPEVFSKMSNLKFLIINFHNMQLPLGLKCLCSSLKVLHWMEYPLKELPLGVQIDKVVEIRMCHSKIKRIWKGNHSFSELKFIDLSHSKDLIQTPKVSGAPCLETLLLEGCTSLVEVHQSVAQHKKLVLLNLKDCTNLQTLPRKFEMDSLEELILSGCSKVKKLPEFGENMKSLSVLNLENCKNLQCLPNSVGNLKSIRKLNIRGCSKFSTLPKNMNENKSLEELDVS